MSFHGDEIIRLNVGGEYFVTTRDTLTQRHYRTIQTAGTAGTADTISVPVSDYFCSLLSNHHHQTSPPVLNDSDAGDEQQDDEVEEEQRFATSGEALLTTARDESGALFIDRSPQLFGIILEYLRTGELHIPHHVMAAQTIRSPQMAYYGKLGGINGNINNSGSGGGGSGGASGLSGISSSALSSSSSSSSASSIVARMQNLSFGGAVGQQLSNVGIGGGLSRSGSFRTVGGGGGGGGEHERQDSLQGMVDAATGASSSISPREYSGKHSSGTNSSASASIPALSALQHQMPDSSVFLDQANHVYNMFILKLLREADFYMIDLSSQLFNIVGDGIFVTNDKENKCLLFFDKDPLNRPASLFMNGIFMNEFVVDKEVCIRNGVIEVHQNDPRCETPQIVFLLYPSEAMIDHGSSGSGYRQSSPLLFGRKRLSSFEGGRFANMVSDVEGMDDENTLQEDDTSVFIDETDMKDHVESSRSSSNNNSNNSSSSKSSGRRISKKRRPVNTSSLFEYLLHKVHPKSQGPSKGSSSSSRDDDNIHSIGMNTRNLRTGLIFSDARTTSTSGHSVSLQVKDLRNFRQSISLFPAVSPSNMQLLLDRLYVDLEDFNHNIMFQRIDERHMRVVETTLRNPSICGNNRPGSQNLGQAHLTVLDFDSIPDNDARTRILGTSVKHRNRLSLSGDKIILETVFAIMDNNFLAKAKDNFIYIESRNRCYWIRNGCLLIFELANKKL